MLQYLLQGTRRRCEDTQLSEGKLAPGENEAKRAGRLGRHLDGAIDFDTSLGFKRL